jgi:pimeloyl-ACP methyl ester carboxylesterase
MASPASTLNIVTSRDGTRIAVERTGNGPAVVIVDGALCSRAFGPGEATAAALSGEFSVHRYDRRGRGDSTDTPPYAIEREVEDLAAVIAATGGPASVYGISSGAALAIRAAASGVPMSKLAMFEPPYTAQGGDPDRQRQDMQQMAELLEQGRRGDAVALFLGWVGMPDEVVAQMKHSPVWATLEAIAPTLGYDSAVMGDGLVPWDQARHVSVPTLVIAGALSSPDLRRAAQAVTEAIPGARYRELEGQAHTASPESLAPLLKEFLG